MESKAQEKILEQFFKDYNEKSHVQMGYKLVAIIFSVILVLVMLFPYQALGEADKAVINSALLIGLVPACSYVSAYMNAIDGRGAVTRLDSYLKYLPVSAKTWKVFRLKKLLRFVLRMYLAAQTGQVLFSLIAFHELAWGNILYPVIGAFLAPLLIGVASIWVTK